MARFIFRLQSVLNLKIRLEEQQRNTFAATRKRLDDEEEKLRELIERKESYEEEGRKMRSEALKLRDILDNQNSIERIKEYIEAQKAQIKIWEKRLEEERIKLVEMMRERKTYEKLREKAFQEFKEDQNHEEGVVNDEHNSFVYGADRRS